MTDKLKRMLAGTRTLESRLAGAFEQAARSMTGPTDPRPLEIVDLAAEEVARHVQPSGRGRYGFPYNSVGITFLAPTAEHQSRFNAICAGPPSIEERVLSRLASARCVDPDVDVSVSFASLPDPDWQQQHFHVALARVDRASRIVRGPAVRIDLVVMNGTADRSAYSFATLPVAIGRGAEVRDDRQQLIRINHVAFTEAGSDINQSVSRRHARIELDEPTQRPRIVDDNSAQGTSVIRHGRGIAVPRGSRGLGLRSDDEIVLGQARVRVRLSNDGN